jgi:CrcB protein
VGSAEDGEEPVDPDVDPAVDPGGSAQRREFAPPHRAAVLGAIAVGGIAGAEARYGLGLAIPHDPGRWPWATLLINVSGCALIGVLMVVLLELTHPHPLVRPLLGVGVLGGYTTFSTYATDVLTLLQDGHPAAAVGYFLLTPVLAVAAVAAGVGATRSVAHR